MPTELSYWEKESFFCNYDAIIIGSGIVGLNAAIHLKKSVLSLKIAILERGFLPTGASTKNAGFACFGSISELIEQEEMIGINGLAALIEKRWKGLLKLRNLLGDNTIDYQCLGGYEIFKNEDHFLAETGVSKIEHFNRLVNGIIGSDAFSLKNKKINSFGFDGISTLIENQYEAQIDSGKMMSALIHYAQQLGISIFNGCTVNRIEEDSKGSRLVTSNGTFFCKRLIVTTNAFIKDLYHEVDIKPGRGQVLITKPIKNLKVKGTFHYDKGYYYFRNINNRVLLGGGRNINFNAEETTNFGQTQPVQLALENLLKTIILPKTAFEIDYRWSGIMAFGKILEPFIKEIRPNVFCATRCNGMGIAIGSQTGEDVAELLLKHL
ncbi:NAD(P)/FAD-dependent oxidoreductase [Pedobacter zeae]|uniref:FAD-dependent oxidoreductase n=1 Tax=Pedobacter zeae TaxID=1737356 RepID=A0A7W6KDC3_9SPHI|nr:FAD-binding oxidoreductase [Pedobacter zeae]MBB4109527.1 glycine/D-amino acid oxidase-like deaminating enzyme [Pedobacter zeae]GGH12747.1 FAD-dependent oxidoreductase [Pedobacter zeae]